MSRKQCKKCPWRKGVNPTEIPNGYCETLHAKLKRTIAKPADLNFSGPLHLMACHESKIGKEIPCVGWLNHQYGIGNNITLRIAVFEGKISMDIETVGEQHERFEDTLPKDKTNVPKRSRKRK
jgi:hypothetical protein